MAPSDNDENGQPSSSKHKENDTASTPSANVETVKQREKARTVNRHDQHDSRTNENTHPSHLSRTKQKIFASTPNLLPSPKRFKLGAKTSSSPCPQPSPISKITLSSKALNGGFTET